MARPGVAGRVRRGASVIRSMLNVLPLFLYALALAGCVQSPVSLDTAAKRAGLPHKIVATDHFEHSIYRQPVPNSAPRPVWVFLEGDGRPWNRRGTRPSQDPSPRRALGFELMRATPADALYITRPCYNGHRVPACDPSLWTHARFAPDVVDSLAQGIQTSVDANRRIVLVGYSGGGALAMLLAAKIHNVAAVVTVAGLIDVAAWTTHHGYEPMTGSLKPLVENVPASVRQWHLVGAMDRNVPAAQTQRALRTATAVQVLTFADADHACCWVELWPATWSLIAGQIDQAP